MAGDGIGEPWGNFLEKVRRLDTVAVESSALVGKQNNQLPSSEGTFVRALLSQGIRSVIPR